MRSNIDSGFISIIWIHADECLWEGMALFETSESLERNAKMIQKLLRLSRIPLVGNVFLKQIPRYFVNGRNTKVSHGFSCVYGNIAAEDVDFNDTLCRDYARITVGKHTKFSYQNMILTSSHDFKDFNKIFAEPITIGQNVYVTSRVTILSGVTIGDNTVIGSGSLVISDIPSNVLAFGNPCRVVKPIERMPSGLPALRDLKPFCAISDKPLQRVEPQL